MDSKGYVAPFFGENKERMEGRLTPGGVRNGHMQVSAKHTLSDGDKQGTVTKPDHPVPLLSPLPLLCHPTFASPSDPAWAGQGLGGRRAGGPPPLPLPGRQGCDSSCQRGRGGPGPGAGWVTTCGGCVPQAAAQQPAPTSEALQCSGRIFFLLLVFFLKVLISQGNVQPNASRKGRPGCPGMCQPFRFSVVASTSGPCQCAASPLPSAPGGTRGPEWKQHEVAELPFPRPGTQTDGT